MLTGKISLERLTINICMLGVTQQTQNIALLPTKFFYKLFQECQWEIILKPKLQ